MDQNAVDEAARQLAEAYRGGRRLEALPLASQPATIAEGHRIQDALVARIGEPVGGYKTTGLEPGEVTRGAVLASRILKSPARVKAADLPLLGVESEIAYRLDRDLPPREQAYSFDEVREAVTALPAIEVVDSRFTSYHDTPVLHRLGDFMSNGALVIGEPRGDWCDFDFARIHLVMKSDDDVLYDGLGGHKYGDPLRAAVGLANEMRSGPGLRAGQIVTAGTFSGLLFTKPGHTISIDFEGFGAVEVRFDP
jgi:2-keto-4-pentenoate hydratase